jgi:Family of unknown function (DUF5709)
MDRGISGTDGTDPEEATGVLQPGDSLEDLGGVADVLDTGWSPPERPWAVEDWGTTEREEATGESLTGRLSRELSADAWSDGDGLGDLVDGDGELVDDEVGESRAGRLVGKGQGSWPDDDAELFAFDWGIDVGAASAEEAAVHVIREQGDRGS